MDEQMALGRRYMVSIYEPNKADGAFIFSFIPNGPMQERGPDGSPKRVPNYIVAVREDSRGLTFDWSGTQDEPGADRQVMEAEIPLRMKDRAIWINRVTD